MEALTNGKLPNGDLNGKAESLTNGSINGKLANGATQGLVVSGSLLHEAPVVTQQDMLKRSAELEGELRAGRHSVSEALSAVSELEYKLLKGHEAKMKTMRKFQLLKKKVALLRAENLRMMNEAARQDERLGAIENSRVEYHEKIRAELAGETKRKDDDSDIGDLPMLTNGGVEHGHQNGHAKKGGKRRGSGQHNGVSPDQIGLELRQRRESK
eukprot:gnl/TRDRNA2_/TRDRNA2_165359_c1_seq2.p1 gnl/TRDRNA2_/TRDRNA2_165359_c1~~gnl/TRDRNA2_/TRDRNA2_165359_c1_seq2.p1  ORF type:complete len:221 (+),score=47.47 gnl/TRDRNA2_/TRDRNA2_165359_c1_seq2:26-664(+)